MKTENGYIFLDVVMAMSVLLLALASLGVQYPYRQWQKQELIGFTREVAQDVRRFQQRSLFSAYRNHVPEELAYGARERFIRWGPDDQQVVPYPAYIQRLNPHLRGTIVFHNDGRVSTVQSSPLVLHFAHTRAPYRAEMIFAAQTGRLRLVLREVHGTP